MKKNNIILSLVLAGLWIGIIFPFGKGNYKIALIYPSVTKNVIYKTNPSFTPTEEWELFLLSRNYGYEMFNDYDIDEIGSEVEVVVIPSMEAVSDDMLDEIKHLMEEGKGIFITGNFAEFDEKGNRRIRDDNDVLLNFDITKIGQNEKLSVNHFLEGSTPFSAGLKPGQKILLSTNPALFYAARLSESSHPEGSYLLADNNLPGIVSDFVFKGRLLWFGFNLGQLIDKNKDVILFNSLNWLSSQPTAFLNYLPGNSVFSVVLYKNVERSSGLLSTGRYKPGTEKVNYFISPSLLEKFPGHLKNNNDSSDINIIWDDFLFSHMDSDEKITWLKKLQGQINKFSNQHYYGVSSFGEFKDPDTYRLLAGAGYSFIFSSGYSDSFSYDYDTTNNLYLFVRPSDYSGFHQMLKSKLKPGGIFYVDEDSVGEDVYPLLSAQNCWITTFSGLINWAENRKNISINIDTSEKEKFEVNIKNKNSSDVPYAGIWFSIPHMNNRILVSYAGQERELTFDPDKNMYYLELQSIGGYQEISFRIPVNN